jgi:glycosyltransferase involved in cell wall biosynthesis
VLAAWAALRLRRSKAPLIVDWHEFWTDRYWRSYLGSLRGRVGARVQALCLRCADGSFTFSRMVERRLLDRGHGGEVLRLTGEYAGPEPDEAEVNASSPVPPIAVFAGRHIPEKRVLAIPPAIAAARREIPDLRCAILGEGPNTAELRELVRRLDVEDAIEIRGWAESSEVRATIASASCLLNPSEREGYGVVVVEAAALGTPTIVVAGPENAATELIEPGVNGFVAETDEPEALARLIATAIEGGEELRRTTLGWYEENREALSLQRSIEVVEATYARLTREEPDASSEMGPQP